MAELQRIGGAEAYKAAILSYLQRTNSNELPERRSGEVCPVCGQLKGYGMMLRERRLVPCQCAEPKLRERRYRASRLTVEEADWVLSNYRTPDDDTRAALELARQMVSGEIAWLTLDAPPDHGKTFLAVGIGWEFLAQGKHVYFWPVPDMLDDLRACFERERAQHGDNLTDTSYTHKLDALKTVDLLILDDLGMERRTEWAMEVVESVINARYNAGLPLVVTTQYALNDGAHITERVSSRLQRAKFGRVAVLGGPEWRMRHV